MTTGCDVVVVALESAAVIVALQSDPVVISLQSDPITVSFEQSIIVIDCESADPILIEVGIPGPPGPEGPQGPPGAVLSTVLEAQAGVDLLAGHVVYADATGEWQLARSDALGTTRAYGFITDDATSGFTGTAVNSGQLELLTTEWDAVIEGTSTGGLTAGAQYFLSESASGEITSSSAAIGSGFRVPVGKAITTSRMAVQIDECIKFA